MSELAGKTALAVDDEDAQIEYVSAILDDHGMQAVTANNGIEAQEKLEQMTPDVITLDLMMPEQSGMKFFNLIKQSETLRDIPVIVISGASQVTGVDLKSIIYDDRFAERKLKVFGTEATPDAFLDKPVDPDELVATIRKLTDE